MFNQYLVGNTEKVTHFTAKHTPTAFCTNTPPAGPDSQHVPYAERGAGADAFGLWWNCQGSKVLDYVKKSTEFLIHRYLKQMTDIESMLETLDTNEKLGSAMKSWLNDTRAFAKSWEHDHVVNEGIRDHRMDWILNGLIIPRSSHGFAREQKTVVCAQKIFAMIDQLEGRQERIYDAFFHDHHKGRGEAFALIHGTRELLQQFLHENPVDDDGLASLV